MAVTHKRLTKTLKDILSRASDLFDSNGYSIGSLLRLKVKTFFVMTPPIYSTHDPADIIVADMASKKKLWSNTSVTISSPSNQKPITTYVKKNEMVLYAGLDVVYYGDEPYLSVNAVYNENMFSLYIMSLEDLEELPQMLEQSWEKLF
jgi:hypothetical protein